MARRNSHFTDPISMAEALHAGFPTELIPQLEAALHSYATAPQHAADPFVLAGGRVLCTSSAASSIRVAPLQWCLPLRTAVVRLAATGAWRAAVPVPESSAGSLGEDALALLDPIAAAMHHSATPTHAVRVICTAGGCPVSVSWRVRSGSGDCADEATRDLLQGRYMLDAPRYRAVQSTPWVHTPEAWASEAERRACAELLTTIMGEAAKTAAAAARSSSARHQAADAALPAAGSAGVPYAPRASSPPTSSAAAATKKASTATKKASAPSAPLLPASASGRQVFLSWLAQQQTGPAVAAAAPSPPLDATAFMECLGAAPGHGDVGSTAADELGGAAAEKAAEVTVAGPLAKANADAAALALGMAALSFPPAAPPHPTSTASLPPPPPQPPPPPPPPPPRWRVYSDCPQVRRSVTRARFEFVDSREVADVLWLGEHICDFESLKGGQQGGQQGGAQGGVKGSAGLDAPAHASGALACSRPLLNQFPHESVLTAKNLLAECAQQRYGRRQPWLADTYTLPHELPSFVHRLSAGRSDTCSRGEMRLRSYIIKPWNLSRSRGVVIVDEMAAALALCCTDFGPRLACAYVARPLLLDGRKFDCRMYVGVRSLSPPRLYFCNYWYARVASAAYAGAPTSEHLAHLTVQKYLGVEQEFVEAERCIERLSAARQAAARQAAEADGVGGGRGGGGAIPFEWERLVKPRLLAALADVFRLLVERADVGSEWAGGRCRALYGIDVMFAESSRWQEEEEPDDEGRPQQQPQQQPQPQQAGDVQPVVLEVNYSADFGKPLELRPDFLNEAFAMLFLDEEGEPEAGGLWERLPI